jgi:threonine/homoserine/homoserine lactone efflux protein
MDLTLVAFAVVVLIAVATPGPTVLLALSNGSRHGVGIATFGIVGAALSDIVLIGAVSLGLGALLATSQAWFEVLKWLGVAYLCYLGIRVLRHAGSPTVALSDSAPKSKSDTLTRSVFLRSFLVAVTNPKGYLFFTAFLPQFVNPTAPLLNQYAILTLIFVSIDVMVMWAYAALGASAARTMRAGAQKWIEQLCGSSFLLLAAGLAVYRRSAE